MLHTINIMYYLPAGIQQQHHLKKCWYLIVATGISVTVLSSFSLMEAGSVAGP